MAANFAQVAAFCRTAPRRKSDHIDPRNDNDGHQMPRCARGSARSAHSVSTTWSCEIAGTIFPKYAADATDSAAIVPPLLTKNSIHP